MATNESPSLFFNPQYIPALLKTKAAFPLASIPIKPPSPSKATISLEPLLHTPAEERDFYIPSGNLHRKRQQL